VAPRPRVARRKASSKPKIDSASSVAS
jgi:hypothetical protein